MPLSINRLNKNKCIQNSKIQKIKIQKYLFIHDNVMEYKHRYIMYFAPSQQWGKMTEDNTFAPNHRRNEAVRDECAERKNIAIDVTSKNHKNWHSRLQHGNC